MTTAPEAPSAEPEAFPLSDTLPVEQPDPMRTLGWGVILWAHTWLIQPDGPHAGEPWRFTDSQIHFILWFYAVDERGEWLHIRGAVRRSKGQGKSPFAAALALAELCGPTRFAGWDSVDESAGFTFLAGRPVAMPWVQLAATAESQTAYTMSMVTALAPPGSRIRDVYRLDAGKTRVYLPNGGRLEVITASPHAAEGARATFAIADESEWWMSSNGGHGLEGVLRRNLAKMDGRMIETCNAFVPGQDSIAEKTYNTHVAQIEGRTVHKALLYDSLEAPPDTDPTDDASLRRGLERAYSGSPWVNLDRLMVEYRDPGVDPAMAARFYLNHLVSGDDHWISAQEWALCGPAAQQDPPTPLRSGDMVTLGFDGSIREDATALVASRVDDGHLELLGCWERPPGAREWQVDRVAVDAAMNEAFQRFEVVAAYCDPAHWQDYLDRWQAEHGAELSVRATGGRPMEFWTGGGSLKRMVLALERFREAVGEQALSHNGDPTLTRHILNARTRHSRAGLTISKEFPDSHRKIDAAMAAALAYEARNDCVAAGVDPAGMFVPVRVY